MTFLIKFISKGAPWRLLNLKIQRQFLFKIFSWVGMLSACIIACKCWCMCVSAVPTNQSNGMDAQRSHDWWQTMVPQRTPKGLFIILSEDVMATEAMVFLPKANRHFCLAVYGCIELCCILYLLPLPNFGWFQLHFSDTMTDQFPLFYLHNRFRKHFVIVDPAPSVWW